MGVPKHTPAFVAIRPHIKLFNIVKKEYSETSTINQGEMFSTYYLTNRWCYVNMARDCVKSKKMLRDCNIVPPGSPNSCTTYEPFWFKIVQTRSDGYKLNPEEICDLFWKSFNKTGCSLYILGMTFQQITNNINMLIQEATEHTLPVHVTVGDVVLSCRKINKKKNKGWFGYLCIHDFENGRFKKSNVNISRPRLTQSRPVKNADGGEKKYAVTTIGPLVVKKMTFTQKSLPLTANFR